MDNEKSEEVRHPRVKENDLDTHSLGQSSGMCVLNTRMTRRCRTSSDDREIDENKSKWKKIMIMMM